MTSRCDGPVAGRGCATVASSRVRASCALTASCTSSRPPLSMVCAAGASRSSRVGDPPSSAEPSPSTLTRRSTWTANPSGSRGPVMSASRPGRAPTGSMRLQQRRPSRQRCARPPRPSPWWGRRARRRRSPRRRRPAASRHQLGQRRAVAGRSARRARRRPVKYVAIQMFRCGRRAHRAFATLHEHQPTSRPSYRSRAAAAASGLDVAAVPVDEDQARRPARRGPAELHQQQPQGGRADRDGAAEVLVLAAGAVADGRRDSQFDSSPMPAGQQRRWATAVAMRVSVSSGRCGPCCSVEPTRDDQRGRRALQLPRR